MTRWPMQKVQGLIEFEKNPKGLIAAQTWWCPGALRGGPPWYRRLALPESNGIRGGMASATCARPQRARACSLSFPHERGSKSPPWHM